MLGAQQVFLQARRTEMYLRTVNEFKISDLISNLNTQQRCLCLFVVICILICFINFTFDIANEY